MHNEVHNLYFLPNRGYMQLEHTCGWRLNHLHFHNLDKLSCASFKCELVLLVFSHTAQNYSFCGAVM